MADAKLGELVRAYALAVVEYPAGPLFGSPEQVAAEHRVADAMAAIVAHVREREVELMALATYAEYGYEIGRSTKGAVKDWRNEPPDHTESLRESARALRDAFDQSGAPREGER